MNTTARARSFKIGQRLSTHLSLQFMLLPYVEMLFLKLLLHLAMAENVDLVQSGAPLPSFLCLVTGKADLPLVLHSTHQKLFLFNRVHHSATLLSQDSCALGYLKTL